MVDAGQQLLGTFYVLQHSPHMWEMRARAPQRLPNAPSAPHLLDTFSVPGTFSSPPAGASVNILDFDRRSALHLALENLDTPMVMLLLAHGADVNQSSQDFVSPLHFAAQR